MIEDALTKDGIEMANPSLGHSNMHVDNGLETDEMMLQRLSREGVMGVSVLNKETLDMNLEDTLYAKSDAIAKWLLHDRTFAHDQYDDNYNTLTLKSCLGLEDEDMVGRGFSYDLKEKQTPDIVVVLKRDTLSPYGFHVQTAYADINGEHAKATGKAYTLSDIFHGKVTEKMPPLEKVAIAYNAKHPNLHARYQHENQEIRLTFNAAKSNRAIVAYLKDDGRVNMRLCTDEGRQKLSMEQLEKLYPKAATLINNMCNTIKDLQLDRLHPASELQNGSIDQRSSALNPLHQDQNKDMPGAPDLTNNSHANIGIDIGDAR